MTDIGGNRIWVFDTSSIIQFRRLHNVGPDWKRLLKKLEPLVEDERILFPREVVAELAFNLQGKAPDTILEWTRSMEPKACQVSTDFEAVRRVLERCDQLIDPNKTTGPEQADPWVLALALHLRAYAPGTVTVVTEDRADSINKMSLATACGIWEIPTIPLAAFLRLLGLWKPAS